MTVLLSGAGGGSTEENIEGGRISAFLYKATATGTLEELKFKMAGIVGAKSLVLGLCAAGGAENPGTVLGQGEFKGTISANATITVTGLSIPVTSGTSYWVAVLPIGGEASYLFSFSGSSELVFSEGGGFTKIETGIKWFGSSGILAPFVEGVGSTGGGEPTGAVHQSIAFTHVVKGAKVARGGVAQATSFAQAVAGRKRAVGGVTQPLALVGTVSARKRAAGALAQSLALHGAVGASKRASGAVVQQLAATQAVSARKRALAALAQSTAFTGVVSGHKRAGANVSQTLALHGAVSSSKRAQGAVTQQLALKHIVSTGLKIHILAPTFATIHAYSSSAAVAAYTSTMLPHNFETTATVDPNPKAAAVTAHPTSKAVIEYG
jgi:hypothetical protein